LGNGDVIEMAIPERQAVAPGANYQVTVDGIVHNATRLNETKGPNQKYTEVELAQIAYIRSKTAYDKFGNVVTYFDDKRDWDYFLLGTEIAKYVHKLPFGGENPGPGEFGARRSRLADLMGGTAAGRVANGVDRAWGACAATLVFGNQAWTAGRREWLGDGSQSGDANEFVQNETTFDGCGIVKTQEIATAGQGLWVAMIFGLKSFAAQPVVEAVLAQYGSTFLPDWEVGTLLREGQGHVAKRAVPYILTPTSGFKFGFNIEVSAPDQVEPLAFTWPTHERMRQTVITNCRVASA